MTAYEEYIPLDEREPATVRAAILARSSDPSAKAEDMRSQVEECKEFIAQMGWPVVPPQLIFTEAKTGMRSVPRPILDEVLTLCKRRLIDVVVCREWERVDRIKARRYQTTKTAEDYGVEFRYANLAKDGGKMPDTPMDRIYREVAEEFGQIEAEKIAERTGAGKRRRQLDGLPNGGRAGALYGYAPGERKISHGRQAGCLTWVIDEERARWVRWLFETVAATDSVDFSLRGLVAELDRRGAPTATGVATWERAGLRRLLRQPKYCGRGRGGRYHGAWVKERDPESGRVHPVKKVQDRMSDPDAWQQETAPLAEGAVPPIVSPELWDRVQQVLDAAAALHHRGGVRRTDWLAHSTLLDGGFVCCAECGGRMVRFWAAKDGKPYYQCNKTADVPNHPHRRHGILAETAERVLFETLAHALTDPDEMLLIADAAEHRNREAADRAAVAQAQGAATVQRLAEIAAAQDNVLTALTALTHVSGMEAELTRLRARLAALDKEHEEALAHRHDPQPLIDHAADRATLLHDLFAMRDLIFLPEGGVAETGDEHLGIGRWMAVPQAAAFLDVPADSELGLEIRRGQPFTYETTEGWVADVEADTVATADVLRLRLQQLPRERLRAVLRALGLRVLVERPQPREQWLTGSRIPPADRVAVQIGDQLILSRSSQRVGYIDSNVSWLSQPGIGSTGAGTARLGNRKSGVVSSSSMNAPTTAGSNRMPELRSMRSRTS